MTPIEKAQDLLHDYEVQVRFSMEDCSFTYRDSDYGLAVKRTAKQCALIAVDEIFDIAYWQLYESGGEQEEKYWQVVKKEIEKL
jgi:hypothetical protein